MDNKFGIWIDHRKAIIVSVTPEGEVTQQITSEMEKHVRFSSGESEDGSAEDIRDRRFGNHLNGYYDRVIACLGKTESIQIFGPGEAKGELVARLESKGFGLRIVGIETVD